MLSGIPAHTMGANKSQFEFIPCPILGPAKAIPRCKEVRDRLMATVKRGCHHRRRCEPESAPEFIEKGGADLIMTLQSGHFRMMGHAPPRRDGGPGGDTTPLAMDPARRRRFPWPEVPGDLRSSRHGSGGGGMWHWLGKVKEMGFSGWFPTHVHG